MEQQFVETETEVAIHISTGDSQTCATVCAATHRLSGFPFRKEKLKEKLNLANFTLSFFFFLLYCLNNKGQMEEYSICFPFVYFRL